MLSARPDLKKHTALRFQQDVKRHTDGLGPGQALVMWKAASPGIGTTAVRAAAASAERLTGFREMAADGQQDQFSQSFNKSIRFNAVLASWQETGPELFIR